MRPWYANAEDLRMVTSMLCSIVSARREGAERACGRRTAFSGALPVRGRVGDFLADEVRAIGR